jgi:hypothetical protein
MSHDSDGPAQILLERIESRLAILESELAGLAPLVRERDQLLRAHSLLVGTPCPPTGSRLAVRVSRHEVFEHLTRSPGSTAGEIAAALGCGQPAVSAHLYRGKGRLFSAKAGRWFPVPQAAGPAG